MPRRIHVEPHNSPSEVRQLYKAERDGVRQRHLQVIFLAMEGRFSTEIGSVTGLGRDWVFEIVRRYNQGGVDALGDRRQSNGGHGRVLTQEQEDRLMDAVALGAPDDGGPWTTRKVAEWMTRESGRPVDQKLAWAYLKRLGFSLQQPLRRHVQADPEAQEAFKKGGYALPS